MQPRSVKVILVQRPPGSDISGEDRAEMRDYGPDFVCFPEYFFVDKKLGNFGQTPENQSFQKNRIRDLSLELGCTIIGGTMPEIGRPLNHNTCFIYSRGEERGYYRKKNLFFAEEGKITPGDTYRVFEAEGLRFCVLICADVFHDGAFIFARENRAQLIFSPTFSLYKDESDDEKFKRDRDIYVRGASISGAIIVKVCGVKCDYKPFLQARSLIASPEGILFRVRPDQEDRSMLIKREIPL